MPAAVPEIHVTGSATREVVPDRVVVSALVRTGIEPAAADALRACAEGRRRLLEALRAGRPADEVRDARVQVSPEYAEVQEHAPGTTTRRPDLLGYRGTCRVSVEAPASEAGAILALAAAQRDTAAAGPAFQVSPGLARAVDRELQQEAARDAMDRAAAIAGALGLELGAVIAIGEPGSGDRPEVRMAYARAGFDAGDAGSLAEELGELRPEPETRDARIAVRVQVSPVS